ncbi:1-deoxy-D-xylulose-5-phosphate reductoisomerase protein [Halorhabdus tiamatea SARL4B]|uniref:1-deoxy-D-xylulose-5-phosphate reductoisomerase protein n=1 Tax=Halorhabdus tiamatea SARL4B TaxID=1033806 RepID=F7PIF4_9EURY|nr:aldo/keto reductase [Halorhabdus tiamatea]ERJ07074.1 1-deoxy-D-xylulose-5-phosphate reductoisomerase protein [Halorhabdus tiamatea SARL4B]CCQ34839.1 aldo/keto reductase family oxidoreductase [Halorhabdus tiamatea SARL4B]
MQYRDFGSSIDWEPSALGFGAMRLPTDEEGSVDEDRAIEMIRTAIDNGVNYVDTAWPYHDGESERVVGQALEDGYREEVHLATKMPSWEIESQADLDHYLDAQLDRLGVETVDCYLLHALGQDFWENYQSVDVFGWLEDVHDAGKIDHVGFSFHDDVDLFKEIVDAYDWDFCQIQYNYLDEEFQAGRDGLQYAVDRGLGVIVMEPLRGGRLATDLPDPVAEAFERAAADRPPVAWALQWLWDQPEVSLVLSGMSTMDQVNENVEIASRSGVSQFSADDHAAIEEARDRFEELMAVDCTGCNYCMPCPTGVEIPRNFDLYNRLETGGDPDAVVSTLEDMDDTARADACVACGECEEACPQNLEIISLLEDAHARFEAASA